MERVSSACRSEKAHVEITHIVRQNRAKETAKFPKNFGAPRAQKLRALSIRNEKNLMTSLKLLKKSRVRCHRKSARSASRSRKVLRRNRAKELQNSWKFGAPRAQYLRAIGQCALRKPQNFNAAVCRVGRAFKCKKRESAAVESTQIFHRIRAKELRTSRNFGESRAQKTMPELGQRALGKPENVVNP